MLRLLDTTLRDGSYIIDFQFTASDTAVIAAALDANNVHFIEVGHGVGMGAFRNPRLTAAASDELYLAAAAASVKRNRWGMFFIPGIATMDDLQLAADHGMHFVRVGTNVTETAQATAFISRAKALGMQVFANFMKTYAASPVEVAERAAQVAGDGADFVCVVDSAGGMLPEDVTAYIAAIRSRTEIPVGYHGHNNLGMAVANTLVAVEQGAAVIDTSLRGMGRSAGNASTEMTLFALLRRGIDMGIDPVAMLTIAEQRVDPLLARAAQERSIGVVTGFAQFHSSYLEIIEDVAAEKKVDPRELIIGVTRENKIDAPRALVERVADELSRNARTRSRVSAVVAHDSVQAATLEERVQIATQRLRVAARQRNKCAVLNVVQSVRSGETIVSNVLHEGADAFVSTVEVANPVDANIVRTAADGTVDYLLVDIDEKTPSSIAIVDALMPTASGLLRYSDLTAWTTSVLDILGEWLGGAKSGWRILVAGDRNAPLVRAMRIAVRARGSRVLGSAAADAYRGGWDAIIVCSPAVDDELLRNAVNGTNILMDAWIGGISEAIANDFRKAGARVLRPEMRPALHAEISRALATRKLVANDAGYSIFEGIPVAAGGVVAPRGTIVVDSIVKPAAVHGVADGKGALQLAESMDEEAESVLQRARTLLLHSVG